LLRGTRNFIYETNAAIEWTDARFQTRRELPEAGGCLAVSPDGTRFVTGPWGHSINLWSWPELKRLHRESDVGAAHALAFSPDGKWLAAGTREGRLLLWDASLRTRQAAIQTHGNGVIWSLAFSPDGTRLATAGNDQTVRTWTLPGLTPEHVYRGHRSEVWAVRWSSDGNQLISGSKDTTIRFWEARRGSTRQRLTNLIQAPHFSKDEQFIALRHRNNEASIHDVTTLQTCLRLGDVGELGGFSGTPESIAVLTPDSVLERHSLKDGKVVESRRLAFPPKGLTKRLLSQAGHWLICGLNNGKLLVQNTTNGTPPIALEGHTAGITALEVSQNEEWLVSGSIDQSARLWDLKTLTLKHVYSKHRMGVGDVTFSPDTTRLATGSWDDSVHLWDMNDHRELALLDGHEGGVQAVAQTADARTIGVLSGLGVLKFWNVAVRRETGHIQLGVGPHQGWLSTSASGRWIAAVDAAGELTLLEAPKVFGRK
jgi:WD40 repeat protein